MPYHRHNNRIGRRKVLFGLCAATLAGGGCSAGTPQAAPTLVPARIPFRNNHNGFAVGADPLTDTALRKRIFGVDLTTAGVIAVRVRIENLISEEILVRRSDMTLVLPSGQTLSAIGGTTVASKMNQIGGLLAATIAFGVIGLAVTAAGEDSQHSSRVSDYRAKEFKDTLLDPKESVDGFAFFDVAKNQAAFDRAELVLRVVSVKKGTSQALRLPIEGIGYDPAKKIDAVRENENENH